MPSKTAVKISIRSKNQLIVKKPHNNAVRFLLIYIFTDCQQFIPAVMPLNVTVITFQLSFFARSSRLRQSVSIQK